MQTDEKNNKPDDKEVIESAAVNSEISGESNDSLPTELDLANEALEEEALQLLNEANSQNHLTLPLDSEKIRSIVESILFVSDKPVTLDRLHKAIPSADKAFIKASLEELKLFYEQSNFSGIFLDEVAEGYQIRTRVENAPWIREFVATKPVRLGPAAMEVLAIAAYRQPITRAQIESLRGVDCGAALRNLLERKLLKIIGKVDEPGRPLLYGTTKYFLEVFGLKNLTELPTLKEFQELTPEESEKIQILRQAQGEEDLDEDVSQESSIESPDEISSIELN